MKNLIPTYVFRGALWASMLAVVSFVFLSSADARGRSTRSKTEWDKSANECFQIFEEFDMVPIEQVTQCAAIWAAYNSSDKIRASQKFVLIKAFTFLFEKGDSAQSWVAYNALKRLGQAPELEEETGMNAPPKPANGMSSAAGGGVAPPALPPETVKRSSRDTYNPSSATKGEHKRARKKNGVGVKAEKRKLYESALEAYEAAIELDPRYETAIFNAARMYGKLGQGDSAARYLENLQDLETEDAARYLHKARIDTMFKPARDNQSFKDVTGYARIKLLNGKGVYGEDEVERIEEYLSKAFYSIDEMTHDPHDREFPVIWHKGGTARNTAFIVSKFVNHPKTILVPIDWETEYDIVITWGDSFEKDPRTGQPMVKEYEMKDPEGAANDALYEQDKALREPEKFSREVDKSARTPQRMQGNAERSVQRVENTMNVIDKTGKTVESGGGMFK